MKRNGIEAKLVNIYFIGDMKSKNRNSPLDKKTWLIEIAKMKECLGIKNAKSMGIFKLFLNVEDLET